MRFKLLCVFLGAGCGVLNAAGWAAGVSSPLESQNVSGAAVQTITSRSGDTIDPKNGYIPWRWIGALRKGSAACPRIAGWEPPKPLIPRQGGHTPGWYRALTAADQALISDLGLDRFCVYTTTTRPIPRFVIPRGSDLIAARPDRMAVSVAGLDGLAEAQKSLPTVHSVLADEFRRQTGRVALPLTGPPKVQITFLDSEPDGALSFASHPGLQHGYTLGHLAREIVCGGSCAATIWNSRALAYGDPSPDPLPDDQAGNIGAISELGPKILQAIGEWKLSGQTSHLVLNLSIGWDGEILLARGETDLKALSVSALEPSVQNIYLALQFAARENVLVIAAAGNRRGGSLHDSNWPLLPAAWEFHHPTLPPFGPKLVYAVGGVDWQGLPLPNSRTKGLPRRVAYGDHATVDVNGRPTAVYTGTSVSAAVVSSVAAVIWNLRPELRADQVMWLVDHSAIPTPQRVLADFYPGRKPPRIHVVSLCAAVERAWVATTAAPTCPPPDWQPPVLHQFFSRIELSAPFFHLVSARPSLSCHSRTLLFSREGSVPPPICPTDQFSSVFSQRWVFPQPGANPCANCVLFPTGPPAKRSALASSDKPLYDLVIELDPNWIADLGGATGVATARLEIDRFQGGELRKRMTYPIHFDPALGKLTVTGLGDGKSLKGCRAQLNWVVTKIVMGDRTTMSVQSPVVVDP